MTSQERYKRLPERMALVDLSREQVLALDFDARPLRIDDAPAECERRIALLRGLIRFDFAEEQVERVERLQRECLAWLAARKLPAGSCDGAVYQMLDAAPKGVDVRSLALELLGDPTLGGPCLHSLLRRARYRMDRLRPEDFRRIIGKFERAAPFTSSRAHELLGACDLLLAITSKRQHRMLGMELAPVLARAVGALAESVVLDSVEGLETLDVCVAVALQLERDEILTALLNALSAREQEVSKDTTEPSQPLRRLRWFLAVVAMIVAVRAEDVPEFRQQIARAREQFLAPFSAKAVHGIDGLRVHELERRLAFEAARLGVLEDYVACLAVRSPGMLGR
ncbi:MAG: hypothetical protein HUU28_01425 [Planctomycetaceae bacterium]|nr:hypothetical protein [Planctomycetaceae bacterium]